MPRYFFHLYNHLQCTDEEGTELPDIDAARSRAVESARETMSHDVKQGEVCLSHRIEVADESDRRVLVLRFGEAVSILP
ncbi:MAG TPA: hypothetical protein VFW19_17970 [Allosphingosinicella sp.]|nr:hypothetical protein [Allosphingosinicella sp.]